MSPRIIENSGTVAGAGGHMMSASRIALASFRRDLLPSVEEFFRSNTQRFRRNGRKARAVCPFHPRAEHQNFSMDLDRGLFHCFVCDASGDLITFVMQRDNVDFREAARRLGALVAVDNPKAMTNPERDRQRGRIDLAADKLAQIQRSIRLDCGEKIRDCDRVLATPGPWDERQWRRAQAACVLRDDYVLPAYTLLSFAAPRDRARYVLHPEIQAQMAAAVRWAGYVLTADARRVEVLQ